jgi:sugar lactone lactonase YvrE
LDFRGTDLDMVGMRPLSFFGGYEGAWFQTLMGGRGMVTRKAGWAAGVVAAALVLCGGARAYADDVYVGNWSDGKIVKITPDGAGSVFASGIRNLEGMAFDGAGNLYASQVNGNAIDKITPGGVVSTFASTSQPDILAFDRANNLYVGHASSIEKITPGGASSTFATGLYFPMGLAFDSEGNLYAANEGNNTIAKITPEGGVSTFVGTGLNNIRGLACDSANNLYVANIGDNTIRMFTPGGVGSVFASTGLNVPEQLAFDHAGNLYVANYGNNTIEKFTPGGVGSAFASGGLLNYPTGIAITPEPATLGLVAAGLAAMIIRRKKQAMPGCKACKNVYENRLGRVVSQN